VSTWKAGLLGCVGLLIACADAGQTGSVQCPAQSSCVCSALDDSVSVEGRVVLIDGDTLEVTVNEVFTPTPTEPAVEVGDRLSGRFQLGLGCGEVTGESLASNDRVFVAYQNRPSGVSLRVIPWTDPLDFGDESFATDAVANLAVPSACAVEAPGESQGECNDRARDESACRISGPASGARGSAGVVGLLLVTALLRRRRMAVSPRPFERAGGQEHRQG
jgi:hypothetical protein